MKSVHKIIGAIIFLGLTFFYSCKKEYSCSNCIVTNTDTTLTDSTMFTDCVIDGTRYFNIGGRDNCGAEYSGGGSETFQFYFAMLGCSSGSGNASNRTSLEFYRGVQLLDTTQPIKPQKINYFNPGSYSYKTIYSPGNGVALIWTDRQGKKWQTDLGIAIQTGSNFTINFTSVVTLVNGVVIGVNVNAVFNCNLYDGQGNVKRITNGRLRLPIWI